MLGHRLACIGERLRRTQTGDSGIRNLPIPIRELPATKDNYPFVIKTSDNRLTYRITFGSDNESFGFHNAKDWFAYLEEWKKTIIAEDQVEVQ